MALVERMQTRMIGLVNAYIDRLMRALEPELRARFLHQDARGKKPPKPPAAPPPASGIPETVFETGEVAISQAFLRSVFHAIDSTAAADLDRALVRRASKPTMKQAADLHNTLTGRNAAPRVIRVATERVLPNAHKLEQEWLRANTDLIQLPERARREVEKVITDPINQGQRVEVVREKIQERLDVVKTRATLIARDQTTKVYGQLQEARQRAAGITHYVWSTSLDERVRGTPGGMWPQGNHFDLEGTTQAWDDPPIIDPRTNERGHPGTAILCRCAAVPILPDDSEDDT